MAEIKKIDWSSAGFAALALSDSVLDVLVAKGVLTQEEKGHVQDAAIAKVSSNPTLADAAEGMKAFFKRP